MQAVRQMDKSLQVHKWFLDHCIERTYDIINTECSKIAATKANAEIVIIAGSNEANALQLPVAHHQAF